MRRWRRKSGPWEHKHHSVGRGAHGVYTKYNATQRHREAILPDTVVARERLRGVCGHFAGVGDHMSTEHPLFVGYCRALCVCLMEGLQMPSCRRVTVIGGV